MFNCCGYLTPECLLFYLIWVREGLSPLSLLLPASPQWQQRQPQPVFKRLFLLDAFFLFCFALLLLSSFSSLCTAPYFRSFNRQFLQFRCNACAAYFSNEAFGLFSGRVGGSISPSQLCGSCRYSRVFGFPTRAMRKGSVCVNMPGRQPGPVWPQQQQQWHTCSVSGWKYIFSSTGFRFLFCFSAGAFRCKCKEE